MTKKITRTLSTTNLEPWPSRVQLSPRISGLRNLWLITQLARVKPHINTSLGFIARHVAAPWPLSTLYTH